MRNLRHGPGSSEVITLITCHILRDLISNLYGKCSLEINTRRAWTLQDGIVKPWIYHFGQDWKNNRGWKWKRGLGVS